MKEHQRAVKQYQVAKYKHNWSVFPNGGGEECDFPSVIKATSLQMQEAHQTPSTKKLHQGTRNQTPPEKTW